MLINHKNSKYKSVFLLSLIILSACASVKAELPYTPTLYAIDTITPINPTSTSIPATPRRSSAVPPGLQPDLNIIPTNTPSPFHIATPWKSINTTPLNLPATWTEQAINANANQNDSASCLPSERGHTSISPSGNWLAISCDPEGGQTLDIVNKENVEWVLQFKDFLADEFVSDGSIPPGDLFPSYWTDDEKYLYFTSYIAFDGGNTCFYGSGVEGLYRINLETGKVATILHTLSYYMSYPGYIIAFSPDGQMIAYILEQPVILNLKTGGKTYIDVGDYTVGDLYWSPDGSELAYATCRQIPDDWKIERSSIEIFSLKTRKSRTIWEENKNFLSIEFWNEPNVLKIKNDYLYPKAIKYLYFDWSTEEFTTPTPTLSP